MYNFNVKEQTENVKNWIRKWFADNGNDQTIAILGVSGGKDSTVTAKLLVEALGKDRVIGIMMPNGTQKDISDSIKVCELLGIRNATVDISKAYNPLTDEITAQLGVSPSNGSKTNTPARLRMTTLYDIAGRIGNCRVANTCNASEDYAYGNFSTLYGDSAGDFAPLQNFTVTEVKAIGDYLGLPSELIHKTPSDGMCGSSDEEKLSSMYGFTWTYEKFDKYLRGQETDFTAEQIEKLKEGSKAGKFKRDLINIPKYVSGLFNAFEYISGLLDK